MNSDLDDIKQLEFALQKAEHLEVKYYISSEDDLSDEEFIQNRNIAIDFQEDVSNLSESDQKQESYAYHLNDVRSYLTNEELEVIESCPSVELTRLMVLNRIKQMKLKNLQIFYASVLQKCYNFINKEETKDITKIVTPKYIKTPAIRLGFPYFKDWQKYNSPLNVEILKKRMNGDISPYYLYDHCRWTLDDQLLMKSAIVSQHNSYQINRIQNDIDEIENALKSIDNPELKEKTLNELLYKKALIDNIATNSRLPPKTFPHIDWCKIADIVSRHSSTSCKSFWNLYLNDDINKKNMPSKEIENLKNIAKAYNYQNWDAIAAELNTGRTGFSACVHHFSSIRSKFSTERFSEEEDQQIIELVNRYRQGNYIPWPKITFELKNRSREQIYHRYHYSLCNSPAVKGYFTDAEDILIFCLLNKFGRNFKEFVPFMPHRSLLQIRHRVLNYLDKLNLTLGNWTYEEDMKILNFVSKHGEKNWYKLTSTISRNRYHIRQRYFCLKGWMDKNPGKDIKEISRRHHQTWSQKSNKALIMKRISDEFKSKLPTLQEIEEFLNNSQPFHTKLKRGIFFVNDIVDVQILELFKGTYKITKPENQSIQINVDKQHVENIKTVCKLLNADFNIPVESELAKYSCLDALDIHILSDLRKSQQLKSDKPCSQSLARTSKFLDKNYYMPPVSETLIALRSMLIKYKSYKQNIMKNSLHYKWTPNEILEEHNIFYERMKTIFKWPCIMSLNQPSEVIKNEKGKEKLSQPPPPALGQRALKRIRMEKVKKMVHAKKIKHQKLLDESKIKDVTECCDEYNGQGPSKLNVEPISNSDDSELD